MHAVIDGIGVAATRRSFWRTQTNRARFEDLLLDPVEFATRDLRLAGFLGLLTVVVYFASKTSPVLNFFGTLAALAASAFAYWDARPERRSSIQLSAGPFPVVLYRDRPDRPSVDRFLADLRTAQQQHLRANYQPNPAPQSVPGELERLFWLKQQGAINDAEYEQLKSRLLSSSAGGTYGQYA